MSQQKPKTDRFFRLKYMGYCMSQMPPEEATIEFDDFVKFAKFQLCRASKRLMKDPIWEDYSDEEILIEYYAILYDKSQEEKAKLEAEFSGVESTSFDDWANSMIDKNKDANKEFKKTLEKMEEDELSYKPDIVGE